MKKWYKILAVVMAVILTATVAYAATKSDWMKPAATKSLYQQAIDDHGFIYGINYPWISGQGCSLSDNEARNLTSTFDSQSVETGFYNVKKIGFDAAILWVFMQAEGIDFDENGDVVGVQDKLLKNLETTLKIAKKHGVGLSLTIMPHLDYNLESGNYSGSKERYDKYSRMFTDPTVREHFFDKAVVPVLELINKYRDTVFAISTTCEPEGDIYGTPNGYKPFGTTIENMTEFMKIMVKYSRKYVPDIPVWSTSGWDHADSLQYFNQIDFDFIGRDIYDNKGAVPSVENATITTPVMLGEFGPGGDRSNYANTLFHLENYKNFITNAKEAGYTGAFYWCYNAKGQWMSLLADSDTSYMAQVPNIYYTIKDGTNEFKGIERPVLDAPTMLYHNVDGSINFIASRDAYEYIIERSLDGKAFSKLDTVAADTVDKTGNLIGVYKDETAEAGVAYYYRVTAVDMDGNTAVGDVSLPVKAKRTTCEPSENLIVDYSFETRTHLDDLKTAPWRLGGTSNPEDILKWNVIKGEAGVDTHSGNTAVKLTAKAEGNSSTWAYVGINVTLKKDTNYTFTFHAKSDKGKVLWKRAETSGLKVRYEATTSIKESDLGIWKAYTHTFNTGECENFTFVFADNGGTVTIDDLYLFETEE